MSGSFGSYTTKFKRIASDFAIALSINNNDNNNDTYCNNNDANTKE